MKQSNLSYISYCGLWPTAASKKACCTCGLVFLSFACTPVSLCAWLYSRLISGLFWAQVVAHKLKAFANIYENTSFAIQSTYSKGFWWLFTVFICVVLQSKRQGHRLRCDTQRGVINWCLFLMDCIVSHAVFLFKPEVLIQYFSLNILWDWCSLAV